MQNMEKKQNSVYLEALKWEKQHQQAYQFLPARLLYNLYQKITSLDLLLPLIYSLLDGFSISHLAICSHQDSATIFHVYGSKSKHSDTHMSTNTDTNTDIEIDGESEILTKESDGKYNHHRSSCTTVGYKPHTIHTSILLYYTVFGCWSSMVGLSAPCWPCLKHHSCLCSFILISCPFPTRVALFFIH